MEDGMEDFWYGMVNLACYGIWKIYVPFHSMPWLWQRSSQLWKVQAAQKSCWIQVVKHRCMA